MSLLDRVSRIVGQISGKPNPVVSDRRHQPRAMVVHHGFMTLPKMPAFPPMSCIIKDVSPTGARLTISDKAVDESMFNSGFNLYLERKDHERECHVVWRKGKEFGVKFFGPTLPPSRQYPKQV